MININNTPWEKLTSADIMALLDSDNGESFFYEFKEDGVRNEQLHKEISAFANTFGGYILLGVTDKKVISGCQKWTEEKIHNVIYNGITPTPNFDIQQFKLDGKTVFVIRIEEGVMPPYITTDGKIFERVSSSSMPIKDSSKLSQLYAKHKDKLKKVARKIGNEKLLGDSIPPNLCAYIDLGFDLQCKDPVNMAKTMLDYDYAEIGSYLREEYANFSISQVAFTRVITIGGMSSISDNTTMVMANASMHNYMVLMADGSAKYRVCLFAQDDGRVDLGPLVLMESWFKKIYTKIFGCNIAQEFIHAHKYAELTVLKQFTTFFDIDTPEQFGLSLDNHIKKYGNNIIVCGDRFPVNNYQIIDHRTINQVSGEFDANTIIKRLFYNPYCFMGIIESGRDNS